MKNNILIVLLSLAFSPSFAQNFQFNISGLYTASTPTSSYVNSSQDLRFDVNPAYRCSVKKETLDKALLLRDISEGYPTSWVIDYVSTEISTTRHGKLTKASGSNETLSKEQKSILTTAELGGDIFINVKYKYENPANSHIELREMNYSVTLTPEIEAAYIGGYKELENYFRKNAINQISDADSKKLEQTVVRFTINEEGKTINPQIKKSSGNSKIDKLLLDAILNMPKWIPAQNGKGVKAKQEFIFGLGSGGC